MKTCLLAATAVAVLSPVPVAAQMMDHSKMPGMTMPEAPKAKPKTKPRAKPVPPKTRAAPAKTGSRPSPERDDAAAPPMDHSQMDHSAMGHDMPMPPPTPVPAPDSPADEPQMGNAGMSGSMTMDAGMAGMGMGGSDYAQGSGTSRLPAAEGMMRGVMRHTGDWMLMLHGYAWGAYTDQGGPRGDDMAFVQSMGMITAQRPIGDGARLQLQTMLSLEPLMGARGYPNLLATGETANGQPLIDRQHPHDLFMEVSARVDIDVAPDTSLFLYGGPVGEPALGPSAFMHRKSAQYQPLSPITHHWFDSTHITYGVVTAGISAPTFQIEASAFRGREPDEHRWGIETPRLDSWSVRGTWTPSANWALQVSHGQLREPEELEPGRDEARTTASVNYATGPLTTTFAFSAKNKRPGPTLTAYLAEANYDLTDRHSLFLRGESVANDELFPDDADPRHHRIFRVGKIEGGYAYRMPLSGALGLALGGTVGTYVLPDALDSAYGKMPVSFTVFAKLQLGR